MIVTFYLLLFLIGAITGSFYITLAFRILKYFYSQERKKYTFRGKLYRVLVYKNQCDVCHHDITWIDVIPVLGYFITRRKCRNCGTAIPAIYPLTEFVFGLTMVMVFTLSHDFILSFAFLFLSGHLLVSAVTDWNYYSLDYENLLFVVLFGMAVIYRLDGFPGLSHFYIFTGFFAAYLLIWFFFRNMIGFGDVLFSPFYAVIAGQPWWIMYLNISYAAALISALLLRKKGESLKKKVLPMGAFLSLGLFITLSGKIYFIYAGYNG